MGARVEYYPLRFVGIGVEGGVKPTRSPELDASTAIYAVRGHVIGQLPYRFTPMLLLGGGILGNGSALPILSSSKGAFHWGGGLKYHVNKWIAVRLDGRHVVADTGSSRFSVAEVTIGLDVTLRLRDWIAPRDPRDRDSDADGVTDSKDPCPATPGSDGQGCPPHLRDTDDDGIKDNKDRCPKEWADTPSGCSLRDKDADGIPDAQDRCIDEPENLNGWSDTDGCPDEVPEAVAAFSGVIRGINFDSGKAKIRKSSHKLLNKAAKTLEAFPEMTIEVIGHTDDQGDRDSNLALSQRRADAVKNYLVDRGVDAARVYTRGAGPDEPIEDNKSKKGRAKNRRIEFRLVGR
jgi:OOP family OmpA-OmpF porin